MHLIIVVVVNKNFIADLMETDSANYKCDVIGRNASMSVLVNVSGNNLPINTVTIPLLSHFVPRVQCKIGNYRSMQVES
jgi:hypothetical protein